MLIKKNFSYEKFFSSQTSRAAVRSPKFGSFDAGRKSSLSHTNQPVFFIFTVIHALVGEIASVCTRLFENIGKAAVAQ